MSRDAVAAMDADELDELAASIRRFLVASVALTGGHLGSNLGVVELTLALHRVFESPGDRIVWDTGHQGYVHKVVTGRAHDFAGLRQAGGLSGYPSRAESDHNLVENSHASTALSYAFGLAEAARLTGAGGRVVAVIGDGALTGGLAYEALNNIGVAGVPVLVVLNDNGRSYAPTVSALSTAGRLDDELVDPKAPAGFFEALGISYAGPVDGHDVVGLERALREATQVAGPVVVHVHTVKGRGYSFAEADQAKCLHDIGPFDPDTGVAVARAGRSYTAAFAQALVAEAARRPEVVAITAAMDGPTGLTSFKERFPDRFFDVGIAEQHAVTAAAGMAMAGLRPVVAIYSTFLNRAWDQVYYDVGLHRLPVVLCLDRAGITGDDGPSHHGVTDLALLTKVPGMTVLAPSTDAEVGAMLRWALDQATGPVAIRWPKTQACGRAAAGEGVAARQLASGGDVCLIGVGKLVAACEEAAGLLASEGLTASVWDARAVAPLDEVMLDHAAAHPLVLVAEDGVVEGGAGALVTSALARRCGGRVPRVLCAGVPVAYVPHGRPADILAALGLDGRGVAERVLAHRAAEAGAP
ncbi:MAG: 1-deoxy-D-xylulose-5-phosphate synthase [Acidimicrobiales bacterium]